VTAIAAQPLLRPDRAASARAWPAVGLSVVAHLLLFAILSLTFFTHREPPPPTAMDVTIADDVGLQARAPQSVTPPAQSLAPDLGKPEDAAPPAPSEATAEPTPLKPQPEAAPPPKPAPVAKPQPPRKAAPPAPQPAKAPARPAPSSALAKIVGKGSGATAGAKVQRPRGSNLGSVMSGLTASPSKATSTAPQAAMTGAARTDIGRKIAERIQPCAENHKLPPTPGINNVRVVVTLSFGRDGYPSAAPKIVRIEGLSGDAERYADLVRRSALATFSDRSCQPMRGLPDNLYDVPGGWRIWTLGFRLPG
jgi:outer membrane biosynthesis protein TonB